MLQNIFKVFFQKTKEHSAQEISRETLRGTFLASKTGKRPRPHNPWRVCFYSERLLATLFTFSEIEIALVFQTLTARDLKKGKGGKSCEEREEEIRKFRKLSENE